MVNEVNNALALFCDALGQNLSSIEQLERFEHYFDLWVKKNSWVVTNWYDLRLAARDAQTYLLRQPQFIQLVVTPYDYMKIINIVDDIYNIFIEARSARMNL